MTEMQKCCQLWNETKCGKGHCVQQIPVLSQVEEETLTWSTLGSESINAVYIASDALENKPPTQGGGYLAN
jgi:hypothetical protein